MSLKALKNYYRVDEVPVLLNVLLTCLSYAVALLIRFYLLLVHYTSSITIEGEEHLSGNYIFCHWHQFIAPYFCTFSRPANQIWLQHPMWYMKPIHCLLKLYGIKYILGSSGNRGKEAANELSLKLQQGHSTTIFPDGPAGPANVLKKGVLHIARQSNLKVVAIQFQSSRNFNIASWDNKFIPLPFSNIHVRVADPIDIAADDKEAIEQLTHLLNSHT